MQTKSRAKHKTYTVVVRFQPMRLLLSGLTFMKLLLEQLKLLQGGVTGKILYTMSKNFNKTGWGGDPPKSGN
jgi:hypothetical protein